MTQAQQYFTSMGFGVGFFLFLGFAFFKVKELDPAKYLILRIMTAIFGAITAGLFTGAATLQYSQKLPGGEFTVSGVAGFAIFILVWLKFPPPPPPNVPDKNDVNFHVPKGWTFKQSVNAIAELRGHTADYGNLTKVELDSPLKDWEIHAKDTIVAIRKLRDITAVADSVRDYDVTDQEATYYLRARVAMTINTCDCPNPPGGQIRCDSNQIAVCRVINNVAVGDCISPPFEESAARMLVKTWELITKEQLPGTTQLSQNQLQILRSGVYEAATPGSPRVTFILPQSISRAL